MQSSLYGICHSNRNFADPYYWGKNQFNSSFPVALACYMRDRGISSNYLCLDKDLNLTWTESTFDHVFNTSTANSGLNFQFETRFEPFSQYCHDDLKPIDLVIRTEGSAGVPLRPLEIKLTNLPDNTTANSSDEDYGCELVVRNPTTRYMALSMAHACRDQFHTVRDIFDASCHAVRNWDNIEEMNRKKQSIFSALDEFLRTFCEYQQPLLMQPVWKTLGKSAELAEHCLDIFVWSDFALSRLFFSDPEVNETERISRPQRTALRLARCLYEIASKGKVYQQPIYDGMTYDTLNDKEFAISGSRTNALMRSPRLTKPIVTKHQIKEIILGGGQKYLSPERRFDAIIYFSRDLFEERQEDG